MFSGETFKLLSILSFPVTQEAKGFLIEILCSLVDSAL